MYSKSALFSLLAAPLFVFAAPQYSSAASAGVTHTIVVGGPNGELTFTPEAISAATGDIVLFEFHQKNHTATQSSFAAPCGALAGGFDSGFVPVAQGVTSGFPTFSYSVQTTNPIWVHCAQGNGAHCKAGMVFAINCGADGTANSFTNFKNAAMGSTVGQYPYTPASSVSLGVSGPTPAPNPDTPVTVTDTITLSGSTWTTTYASYPNSPNPTPNSLAGTQHVVVVGGPGKLAYDPPFISAQPRDQIVFQFHQKNHTATQSSFADPCRKLEFTSTSGQIGFDSGFMPVADNATEFPTFTVTVNDTAPIWVYCRQATHCGSGMVFAINSDETAGSQRSFAAFQALAKQINGTGATNTTGGSTPGGSTGAGTGTGTSGALSTRASLAGVGVGLVGLLAGLVL